MHFYASATPLLKVRREHRNADLCQARIERTAMTRFREAFETGERARASSRCRKRILILDAAILLHCPSRFRKEC
jgi:hypothetical protein